MKPTMLTSAAVAAMVCGFAVGTALPLQADYYWLLGGNLKSGAGSQSDSSGLGCWLELTNDTAGVECKPIRIYDIRRRTTGGTDIVKYSGNSGLIPFDGCRYGEAEIDLTLPIRGADGTKYTLVGLNSQAFQENYYIGKVILPETIEFIMSKAFYNMLYLRTVVLPDPATWKPTEITRAFEGCSRLEGPIVWPDSMETVSGYTFSGDGALKGFSGKGVTNYTGAAFSGISAAFVLEMSEAAKISFTGDIIAFDGRPNVIVWHGTPPSTGDYFSKLGTSFMKRSGTSRVHYIPYDETEVDGVSARWAAYKTDFEAETSGNSLTFPVYDPATGTQTDGSWYINSRAASADKVRFWFPGNTAALLMK